MNLLNSSNANNATILQHKHLEDHIVSNANNFNAPPSSSSASKSNSTSSAQTLTGAANLTASVPGREESNFHYQPTPTVRMEPSPVNNQTQNAQLIPNINKNSNITINSLESTLSSLVQQPKSLPSNDIKQTFPSSNLDQADVKQQSSNLVQSNPTSSNNIIQNISSNLLDQPGIKQQTFNFVKKSNSSMMSEADDNKLFSRTLQNAFQKKTLSIDAIEKQFNRRHNVNDSTILHDSSHPEISLRSLIEKNSTLLDQIDDFIESKLNHKSAVIVPQSNSDRRDCLSKGDLNCSIIIEDEPSKQNEETSILDQTKTSNFLEKAKDKLSNPLTIESPSSKQIQEPPQQQQNPLNQNEAALPVARKLISKLLEDPSSSSTNKETFKPTPSVQQTAQLRSGLIDQPRSGFSHNQPQFDSMETILEMAKIGTIAMKLAKNAAFPISPLGSPDTWANAAKAFVANSAEKLPTNQAVVVEKQFFPKEKNEEDATKLVEKSMQVSPSIEKPVATKPTVDDTVDKEQTLVPSKPEVIETKKKEEEAFPTVADDSGSCFDCFFLNRWF